MHGDMILKNRVIMNDDDLAVNGAILLNVPTGLLAQCFKHVILVCMLWELVVPMQAQALVDVGSHHAAPPLSLPIVLPFPVCRPPQRRPYMAVTPLPLHHPWPLACLDATLALLDQTLLHIMINLHLLLRYSFYLLLCSLTQIHTYMYDNI